MADSFTKKENLKKKAKKKQDKAMRREDRKVNNNKGKTLEDLLVYVDVNGNFTDIPTHLQNRDEDLLKSQMEKANILANNDVDLVRNGVITHVNEKGYGFITEDKTKDNVFFNFDVSNFKLGKNSRVTFKKEITPKGFRAKEILNK